MEAVSYTHLIISRGRALGYTLSIPKEDKVLNSLGEMRDELAVFMGGRVAEELSLIHISSLTRTCCGFGTMRYLLSTIMTTYRLCLAQASCSTRDSCSYKPAVP